MWTNKVDFASKHYYNLLFVISMTSHDVEQQLSIRYFVDNCVFTWWLKKYMFCFIITPRFIDEESQITIVCKRVESVLRWSLSFSTKVISKRVLGKLGSRYSCWWFRWRFQKERKKNRKREKSRMGSLNVKRTGKKTKRCLLSTRKLPFQGLNCF